MVQLDNEDSPSITVAIDGAFQSQGLDRMKIPLTPEQQKAEEDIVASDAPPEDDEFKPH